MVPVVARVADQAETGLAVPGQEEVARDLKVVLLVKVKVEDKDKDSVVKVRDHKVVRAAVLADRKVDPAEVQVAPAARMGQVDRAADLIQNECSPMPWNSIPIKMAS